MPGSFELGVARRKGTLGKMGKIRNLPALLARLLSMLPDRKD